MSVNFASIVPSSVETVTHFGFWKEGRTLKGFWHDLYNRCFGSVSPEDHNRITLEDVLDGYADSSFFIEKVVEDLGKQVPSSRISLEEVKTMLTLALQTRGAWNSVFAAGTSCPSWVKEWVLASKKELDTFALKYPVGILLWDQETGVLSCHDVSGLTLHIREDDEWLLTNSANYMANAKKNLTLKKELEGSQQKSLESLFEEVKKLDLAGEALFPDSWICHLPPEDAFQSGEKQQSIEALHSLRQKQKRIFTQFCMSPLPNSHNVYDSLEEKDRFLVQDVLKNILHETNRDLFGKSGYVDPEADPCSLHHAIQNAWDTFVIEHDRVFLEKKEMIRQVLFEINMYSTAIGVSKIPEQDLFRVSEGDLDEMLEDLLGDLHLIKDELFPAHQKKVLEFFRDVQEKITEEKRALGVFSKDIANIALGGLKRSHDPNSWCIEQEALCKKEGEILEAILARREQLDKAEGLRAEYNELVDEIKTITHQSLRRKKPPVSVKELGSFMADCPKEIKALKAKIANIEKIRDSLY